MTLFLFRKHFLSEERTCAKKETLFASQKSFTEKCYRSSFGKAFLSKKRFVLKEKLWLSKKRFVLKEKLWEYIFSQGFYRR
jgi:hypothetical protein